MVEHASLAGVLSLLAALGLLAVGIMAVLVPRLLAQSYGLPLQTGEGRGFVLATGVRDAILGALLLAAYVRGDRATLTAFAVGGLALSLADLAIAYFNGGRTLRREHGAHIAGAIGFAITLGALMRH